MTSHPFEKPSWPFPPDVPWPRFLRMLRHPDPPRGWLEQAAEIHDVARRPLLLRWIAQHRKAPAHLRVSLLGILPWKALALVAGDPSAHPQARQGATDRLQFLWPALSLGEKRALSLNLPKALWILPWRCPDSRVIQHFLLNPRLGLEQLLALIQSPLTPAQVEALLHSPWKGIEPLAAQVLLAMDQTLERPDHGLVWGMAAPWILDLSFETRLDTANHILDPFLRRLVRARREPLDPEWPTSYPAIQLNGDSDAQDFETQPS